MIDSIGLRPFVWLPQLESFVAGMLAVSAVSLGGAAWALSARPKGAYHVAAVCFFLFEACVGLYFPSIGTLRSKSFPLHPSIHPSIHPPTHPLSPLPLTDCLNLQPFPHAPSPRPPLDSQSGAHALCALPQLTSLPLPRMQRFDPSSDTCRIRTRAPS